jgi:endoglucanase
LVDARWDGGIVGQGGPTNDDLSDIWSQLATEYADEDKVIFGIMNEPHDGKPRPFSLVEEALCTPIEMNGLTVF